MRLGIIFLIGLVWNGYGKQQLPLVFYNLKHEKTHVRFGPGPQFPIKFSLYGKLPVEIIKSHEEWYLIHDFEGEEGWVQKRMVAQQGIVLTTKKTHLKKDKKMTSPILAQLSKGVLIRLKECHNKLCRAEAIQGKRKITGWVPEKDLWGVNESR